MLLSSRQFWFSQTQPLRTKWLRGGGVVVDKISGVRQVAGGIVPDELVKAWQGFGIEQVITQAQAFAALLARRAFQTNFRKRRALAARLAASYYQGHQPFFVPASDGASIPHVQKQTPP